MAYYKYQEFLVQQKSPEFDIVYAPNASLPVSGVYRCEGCGLSATFVKDRNIPPHNHHRHNAAQGKIRWRLVVKSHWA